MASLQAGVGPDEPVVEITLQELLERTAAPPARAVHRTPSWAVVVLLTVTAAAVCAIVLVGPLALQAAAVSLTALMLLLHLVHRRGNKVQRG